MKKVFISIFTCVVISLLSGCSQGPETTGFEVSPTKQIDYGSSGGSTIITVRSESDWSVKSSEEWCQIISRTSKNFTIFADENKTDRDMPDAYVTVTGQDSGRTVTVTIKVRQSAGENYIIVAPLEELVFPTDGATRTFTVSTGHETWDVVSDKDWCEIVKGDNEFTVSVGANYKAERKALITVKAGSEEWKGELIQSGCTALSAEGTANCYEVHSPGWFCFDATVIGNGDKGLTDGFHTNSASISPASAKLLWQDYYAGGKGLISFVGLVSGSDVMFKVEEPYTPGNAVIAVLDGNENILWSWHIWMPGNGVSTLNTDTGYVVMDRNLGAVSGKVADPGSYGMLYQWGRKDPFPASATLTGTVATIGKTIYDIDGNEVRITNSSWYNTDNNTLEYAIGNPMVCLSNYSQLTTSKDWLAAGMQVDALWGNPQGNVKDDENKYVNKGLKSVYDPCPVGWRVPPADVFRNFTSSGGYAWANTNGEVPDFNVRDRNGDGTKSVDDYEYGWEFMVNADDWSYFPAAARFDGSYAMLYGSVSGLWGSYWGNAPGSIGIGTGFAVLSFQVEDGNGNSMITTSPNGSASRADAFSVRCVRE